MNTTMWVGVYFPLFVLFFIIIPADQRRKRVLRKNKLKKGKNKMTNELIKECIGRKCNIVKGELGGGYGKVTIVDVMDNWIKIDVKGKIELVNIDYVQNIKILDK